MAPFDTLDFDAALAAADEACAQLETMAEADARRAQTIPGRREAHEALLKELLAAFGLNAPLTDQQALVLRKLLDHTFTTLPYGYAALASEGPALAVLARMGLVAYERERVGPLGPNARTLTVWRLLRPGLKIAIALERDELPTAEDIAEDAALDAASGRCAA